jgi:threonine/homoserine/homoserine lactone efflux protein
VENLVLFVSSVLLVLIVPGPTNTLLATSGATVGFRRSLPLLVGELAGYLTSILLIQALLKPAMSGTPSIALAMRIAAGAYLMLLSFKLWKTPMLVSHAVISVRQLFITTLLNPKAFAFAVLIIPSGAARFSLYHGLFAAMVPAIGILWISAGHALGRATQAAYVSVIPKAASVILAMFSVILIGSVLLPRPH